MKIKVKYHNNNIPKLQKNPKGDLIDLYAAETVELKAGEHKLISLGVSMKLPEGYKAELTPRSSTYKTWGILQWNSVGQIDNSYSGTNDIWRFPALAMRDTVIHEGDKICQFELKKATMNNVLFEESDTLDDTDRGGFGSTGRRQNNGGDMEDVLLTRQEVADYLKVSLKTADEFIHNKDFDGLLYLGRSVRISKNRLLEYIQQRLEYRM